MATYYVVLWGQRGVSGRFRKLARAKKFAQNKANKLRQTVDIDKIVTYPKARRGQTDWTQSFKCSVKPKMKIKRRRR